MWNFKEHIFVSNTSGHSFCTAHTLIYLCWYIVASAIVTITLEAACNILQNKGDYDGYEPRYYYDPEKNECFTFGYRYEYDFVTITT